MTPEEREFEQQRLIREYLSTYGQPVPVTVTSASVAIVAPVIECVGPRPCRRYRGDVVEGSAIDLAIKALRLAGGELTFIELAERLIAEGFSGQPESLRKRIEVAVANGKIRRTARATYALAEAA